MNEELTPCAHCGYDAKIRKTRYEGGECYKIICHGCEITAWHMYKKDLINLWNTRTEPPKPTVDLSGLAVLLKDQYTKNTSFGSVELRHMERWAENILQILQPLNEEDLEANRSIYWWVMNKFGIKKGSTYYEPELKASHCARLIHEYVSLNSKPSVDVEGLVDILSRGMSDIHDGISSGTIRDNRPNKNEDNMIDYNGNVVPLPNKKEELMTKAKTIQIIPVESDFNNTRTEPKPTVDVEGLFSKAEQDINSKDQYDGYGGMFTSHDNHDVEISDVMEVLGKLKTSILSKLNN